MVDESVNKTDNRMGTQNNVLEIDEADFEVFDALDRDLASSNAGEAMRKMSGAGAQAPSHDTPNDRELEKLKVRHRFHLCIYAYVIGRAGNARLACECVTVKTFLSKVDTVHIHRQVAYCPLSITYYL
jgi:hypothetical protein